MFRFAIVVLAGIGLGALLFGGTSSTAAGVGFLALIPIFFFFKVLFVAMLFGMFARHRFGNQWSRDDYRPPWSRGQGSRRGSRSSDKEDGSAQTERFEEWHRMAHAKEEVDSWADAPE